MKVSEIFESAYKKGRQTKYLHKKEFHFLRNGKIVLNTTIDFKMTDEELTKELLEMKEMSDADQIFLVWTANEGYCNVEIDLGDD